MSKVYATFDEKELEIKVESVPNTLSGCCLAERCGSVQVCVLTRPALQWVLGGCSELGSTCVSNNTPHVEDALFIFRICLNVFFSKSDAVEVGVVQLSV